MLYLYFVVAALLWGEGVISSSSRRLTTRYGGGYLIPWGRRDLLSEIYFPCNKEGFYRHPDSCSKFFRCLDETGVGEIYSRFLFQCPYRTSFSEKRQVCVHSACREAPIAPATVPSDDTEQPNEAQPVDGSIVINPEGAVVGSTDGTMGETINMPEPVGEPDIGSMPDPAVDSGTGSMPESVGETDTGLMPDPAVDSGTGSMPDPSGEPDTGSMPEPVVDSGTGSMPDTVGSGPDSSTDNCDEDLASGTGETSPPSETGAVSPSEGSEGSEPSTGTGESGTGSTEGSEQPGTPEGDNTGESSKPPGGCTCPEHGQTDASTQTGDGQTTGGDQTGSESPSPDGGSMVDGGMTDGGMTDGGATVDSSGTNVMPADMLEVVDQVQPVDTPDTVEVDNSESCATGTYLQSKNYCNLFHACGNLNQLFMCNEETAFTETYQMCRLIFYNADLCTDKSTFRPSRDIFRSVFKWQDVGIVPLTGSIGNAKPFMFVNLGSKSTNLDGQTIKPLPYESLFRFLPSSMIDDTAEDEKFNQYDALSPARYEKDNSNLYQNTFNNPYFSMNPYSLMRSPHNSFRQIPNPATRQNSFSQTPLSILNPFMPSQFGLQNYNFQNKKPLNYINPYSNYNTQYQPVLYYPEVKYNPTENLDSDQSEEDTSDDLTYKYLNYLNSANPTAEQNIQEELPELSARNNDNFNIVALSEEELLALAKLNHEMGQLNRYK